MIPKPRPICLSLIFGTLVPDSESWDEGDGPSMDQGPEIDMCYT